MPTLFLAANRTAFFGAHLQIVRDLGGGADLQEIEVQGDFDGNPFGNQWVVTDNDIDPVGTDVGFRSHFGENTPGTGMNGNVDHSIIALQLSILAKEM